MLKKVNMLYKELDGLFNDMCNEEIVAVAAIVLLMVTMMTVRGPLGWYMAVLIVGSSMITAIVMNVVDYIKKKYNDNKKSIGE